MRILVKKLTPEVKLPAFSRAGDAGIEIFQTKEVGKLSKTNRGEARFGSSGIV